MSEAVGRAFRRFIREERGQVITVAAFALIGMLGMCAIVLDLGRVLYCYRELQATTDAAALAGAQVLHTAKNAGQVTGSGGAVWMYSSASGGKNVRNSLPNVNVTSSLQCLATLQAQGQACVGPVPYNAIQVWQQSSIPTFFGRLFGHATMPIATTSLASVSGGSPRPSNVAVIIDGSLSMNQYDSDCGATQMQCALNGFHILLQKLLPCPNSQSTCANAQGNIPNTFDRVSLFTFPALYTGNAALYGGGYNSSFSSTPSSVDLNCTSPVPAATSQNGYWQVTSPPIGAAVMPVNPSFRNYVAPFYGLATAAPYPLPAAGAGSYDPTQSSPSQGTASYQLTDFLSDYRLSSGSAILNPASSLVIAAGFSTSCGSPSSPPNGGMAPPNEAGVYGTYYAGALYAAQSALIAQQNAYPGSQNVLIILSDGDATAGSSTDNNGNYVPSNQWLGALPVFASSTTSSGIYPSYTGMCGQAVTAAQAAAAAGTLVYSVAYGSPPSGCNSDLQYGAFPGIVPCKTMASMASAPQYFFSDYNQSGSNSVCTSGQAVTSLAGIFTAIANDLTEARLLPIGTQ